MVRLLGYSTSPARKHNVKNNLLKSVILDTNVSFKQEYPLTITVSLLVALHRVIQEKFYKIDYALIEETECESKHSQANNHAKCTNCKMHEDRKTILMRSISLACTKKHQLFKSGQPVVSKNETNEVEDKEAIR